MSGRALVRTEAIVVRLADSGESDRVVGLFTRSLGLVSAIAKGARRSVKRFGGALQTGQRLAVELTPPVASALGRLESATILDAHLGITADLARLGEASEVLRSVREHLPEGESEPVVFALASEVLARISMHGASPSRLAGFHLSLFDALGVGPELDRCVRCGRHAGERAASFDPRRGGVVCTACGGGPIVLSARARELAARLREASPAFPEESGPHVDELLAALAALASAHLAGRGPRTARNPP